MPMISEVARIMKPHLLPIESLLALEADHVK